LSSPTQTRSPHIRPCPRRASEQAGRGVEQAPSRLLPGGSDPVDELIAAAREHNADLIVIGGGKTRLERALHGSVSSSLIRRAPCDVLVTRSTPS
jgi:nucleotide-binding universal stress UspA family protein